MTQKSSRWIAAVLCVLMMVSLLPGGSILGYAAEPALELADDFESYEPGTEPDGAFPAGTAIWNNDATYLHDDKVDSVQVVKDGANQAVSIVNASGGNTIFNSRDLFRYMWAGRTVIQTRIKVGAAATRAMLYISDGVANQVSDLKFAEFKGGKVYVCNRVGEGDEIGTYQPNAWYTVTMTADYDSKSFDLEITGDDGSQIVKENNKWTTEITVCNIRCLVNGKSQNAFAYLDDLKVYRPEGAAVKEGEPVIELPPMYNTEPLEKDPVAGPNPVLEGSSAFCRIEAEYYNEQVQAGAIEDCYDSPDAEKNGKNISQINPGGYLVYRGLDFGAGARGFYARLGSWFTGGDIEIRLDSLDSPAVGSLRVRNTGDWQNWETQSCEIAETSGVHDVYLVFLNNASGVGVASFNWFTFTEAVPTPYEYYVESPAAMPWDTYSDTWVATDSLGRSLPTREEVGGPRQDKTVGLFYFPHLSKKYGKEVLDVTEIEKEDPDFYLTPNKSYYWAEPYFGYYLMTDEWVVRKHAQMFCDAGVDFLFFDVSNGLIYAEEYLTVMRIFEQMRREGKDTPQVVFFCGNNESVGYRDIDYIYDFIYSKGLYKDLWFMWDGKPLIMANTDRVEDEIADFFTVKKSWAWTKNQGWFGKGQDAWAWLDSYPQNYGWNTSPEVPEQISVSIAQHPTSNTGRSFHDGKDPLIKDSAAGLHFQEQWNRALEVDPSVITITGWNEWFATAGDAGDTGREYLGRQLQKGQGFLVDQYDMEYSRDGEPVKGGYGDAYYYQMTDYIRQYKGVRPIPKSAGAKKIEINQDFSQWDDVYPEYRDDKGDTAHRDHVSWTGKYQYVNETGRNDIDITKVSYDQENLYFYAHTQEPLTTPAKQNWMTLYLDVDGDSSTGWAGYNFVLNRKLTKPGTGVLEKTEEGWQWEDVCDISFVAEGNELQFAIPRKALGLEEVSDENLTFDFKWADNSVTDGDPMQFMDQGDAAPNERYNYRFVTGGSPADYVKTTDDVVVEKMNQSVLLKQGSPVVYNKGKADFADPGNAAVMPFEAEGRTMVPVRFLSEAMGADVYWDEAAQKVTVSLGGRTAEMTIGEPSMTVNGTRIALDTAPRKQDDRTYLNLRALCEQGLDQTVYWDESGLISVSDKVLYGDNQAVLDRINHLFDQKMNLIPFKYTLTAEEQSLEMRTVAQARGMEPEQKPEGESAVGGADPLAEDKNLETAPRITLKEGQLQVARVTASDYQNEKDNVHKPSHALDGKTDTHWGCRNEGWILLDMGASATIKQLKIAFFNGKERKYNFTVQVSDDAAQWKDVVTGGQSGGKSNDLETVDLKNAAGRYIRINGSGSSANEWNNYTEIEVYGEGGNPDVETGVASGGVGNSTAEAPKEVKLKDGQLKVVMVDASDYQHDTPQDTHKPVDAFDGDPATKWACRYDGWISMDLGDEKTLSHLMISFFNGKTRTYQLDIQVSSDGISWTDVLKGGSSKGGTTDAEKFDLKGTKARYIRINGHGSSDNEWNGYQEIEVYGS